MAKTGLLGVELECRCETLGLPPSVRRWVTIASGLSSSDKATLSRIRSAGSSSSPNLTGSDRTGPVCQDECGAGSDGRGLATGSATLTTLGRTGADDDAERVGAGAGGDGPQPEAEAEGGVGDTRPDALRPR